MKTRPAQIADAAVNPSREKRMTSNNVRLILIAGGTCSGKTTIGAIGRRITGPPGSSHDNYYKDLSHLPSEEAARQL